MSNVALDLSTLNGTGQVHHPANKEASKEYVRISPGFYHLRPSHSAKGNHKSTWLPIGLDQKPHAVVFSSPVSNQECFARRDHLCIRPVSATGSAQMRCEDEVLIFDSDKLGQGPLICVKLSGYPL